LNKLMKMIEKYTIVRNTSKKCKKKGKKIAEDANSGRRLGKLQATKKHPSGGER